MKQRNPLAVALLPLVTFGLYGLYWLITTSNELKERGNEIKPIWWLFLPVSIVGIAFLSLVISVGTDSTALRLISMLLTIGGYIAAIVIGVYWQYIYAKAVDNVTGGKMSTVVTLLLFFFLGSIGQAIVQDSFNKLGEGAVPAAAPAETPASSPVATNPTPPATETPAAAETPPTDVTPNSNKDA